MKRRCVLIQCRLLPAESELVDELITKVRALLHQRSEWWRARRVTKSVVMRFALLATVKRGGKAFVRGMGF